MKGRPRKIEDAAAWLKVYLSGGSRPVVDILHAGSIQPRKFSEGTLKAAKQLLGVQTKKVGNDSTSVWSWYDPAVAEPEKPKDEPLAEIIHGIAEIKRLSAAPVAAAPRNETDVFVPIGKGIPYDPNDPKNIARQKQFQHYDDVKNIVEVIDPYAVLEASDRDEIDQMLNTVRNHLFDLNNKNTEQVMGKTTSWEIEVPETRTRQVPSFTKSGKPKMRPEPVRDEQGNPVMGDDGMPKADMVPITEPEDYIVMVKQTRTGKKVLGHKQLADISVETAKWNEFIDLAKTRRKQLGF